MTVSKEVAKQALDSLIGKSRAHLYKPMQIAEILYMYRTKRDFDVSDLSQYRKESKKWRDIVTKQLVGNVSTSSAKFQDNLFDDNAIPPKILVALAAENQRTNGAVEAYIYSRFIDKMSQFAIGIDYCEQNDKEIFDLSKFIDLFWQVAGLRRSVDKIYEVIVYSLFQSIIEALGVQVSVSFDPDKVEILEEFEDFAKSVININITNNVFELEGRINRAGVTNASDRGLDIWSNFGVIVQIKHLSLTEEMAEGIVGSVNADRIVIVCKSAEKTLIVSLLNQIGWKSKIQSVITEKELKQWYEKALRGKYADIIGDNLLTYLRSEIQKEFPSTGSGVVDDFAKSRCYQDVAPDTLWLPTNPFSS